MEENIDIRNQNVVYERRRARDKVINRIVASILLYKKGNRESKGFGGTDKSDFTFEDVVLNAQNNFNITRRTALDYTKIAILRAGIKEEDLPNEKVSGFCKNCNRKILIKKSSVKMEM